MLETHGAVSEPVARAMAEGALVHGAMQTSPFPSPALPDPSGGDVVSPVGTVWFGWALQGRGSFIRCVQTAEHHLSGSLGQAVRAAGRRGLPWMACWRSADRQALLTSIPARGRRGSHLRHLQRQHATFIDTPRHHPPVTFSRAAGSPAESCRKPARKCAWIASLRDHSGNAWYRSRSGAGLPPPRRSLPWRARALPAQRQRRHPDFSVTSAARMPQRASSAGFFRSGWTEVGERVRRFAAQVTPALRPAASRCCRSLP